ncbi:PREDICTED: F-box protein At5g25290-like [Camelina sativa]|uniref:F-box protein At5g25290-like n=1 Tax=Camelina sativa TaxID=90675 RepID=A0ABM0XZL6_CAMSA|nr:PREDICTED: F-box protein At5g25290-like [Camelina sativa]
MKTPNFGFWSDLPMDILRSVFERLSFVDLHRAKIVCLNWYSCSKQTVLCKRRPPWLILFPENDVCALYNPDEAKVYKTKRDFSGIRFLANSGEWFLVIDSKSKLYIINLFSEKKIELPPLESMTSDNYSLERVGDSKFKEVRYSSSAVMHYNAKDLRGLLWLDEKKDEYVVVWYFNKSYLCMIHYIAVCKNGEDHYREVLTGVWLPGQCHMVVLERGGDSLYVSMSDQYMNKLDLFGQEGSEDSSMIYRLVPFHSPGPLSGHKKTVSIYNVVTISGEVLLVENIFCGRTMRRIFRLYKKDPNPDPASIIENQIPFFEVDSLGDEALLLDLGITVPADHTLGIEPNSIYFTRYDCTFKRGKKTSCPDICVFNLATKNLKRFPGLSNLKLTDARWFLPS